MRAALEGIAYQVSDIVRAMQRDVGVKISEMRVDGGAAANNFLMQFQSDILDCRVLRPRIIETTGLGVAYLAGLGCGMWSGEEELEKMNGVERAFSPDMSENDRAVRLKGWRSAVNAARQN